MHTIRDMFSFLINLKGNAKASLLTEPMWGVPFNLYAPFFTLYMFQLGVLDVQIGLLLALGRLVQVFTALLGGIVTDKFGRRLVTFVGDCLAWSIPALIWAFAQNFWWFLVAALINSLWQITAISWECLWLDDVSDDKKKIAQIFNWIYVSGLLAVFFAPIAGVLVGQHGLVPVVRGIMIFTFISMTAKFIILYFYSEETERGKERMQKNKNISLAQVLLGYKDVFKQLVKSRTMLRAMSLQSLAQVTILVSTTFFALFVTQDLGLPESLLAYFPILRAGIMLIFLFAIQNRLNKFKQRHIMLVGILLFIAAQWVLVASPAENWFLPALYIVMEACATASLLPRIDTLAAGAIDPKERARIRSLFNVVILAVSSPFAAIAGVLSDVDRRLPFMLNVGLFAVMIIFVIIGGRKVLNRSLPKGHGSIPSQDE